MAAGHHLLGAAAAEMTMAGQWAIPGAWSTPHVSGGQRLHVPGSSSNVDLQVGVAVPPTLDLGGELIPVQPLIPLCWLGMEPVAAGQGLGRGAWAVGGGEVEPGPRAQVNLNLPLFLPASFA